MTASYHGDAQGQSGCSSSRCTYVRVVATGLNGNTDYTVTCRWTGNPGGFSASTVRTNSNGTLVDDPACYYGEAADFWATVGSHRSNTLNAPPP